MIKRLLGLFFIVFLLIGLGSVSAKVIDFNIKPKNPVKGNVVTICGTASPDEDVKIDISFEKVVPVQNGEYVFSVNRIKIPNGKNRFSVTAYGCDNLKVSVKMFFIWVTLSSEASNGVATVSQSNVPPGTYDVVIHGKSRRSSVKLRIMATSYVRADKNGKFSYSYDTSSIPPGEFVISVGGLTKTITLAEATSHPSESSSGPSGGGNSAPVSTLTPTPIRSPTPKPALMGTPVSTPTAMSRPKTTPMLSSTPEQTPKPTHTPIQTTTAGSSVQQMNKKVNQNQKVSKSIGIPGFKSIIAVICLILAIVYGRLK